MNNKIDLYCFDNDTGNTALAINSGQIVAKTFTIGYKPVINAGNENWELYNRGYVNRLENDIYRGGVDNLTMNMVKSQEYVGTIVSDILNNYNSE
jgi:hypothetical protein